MSELNDSWQTPQWLFDELNKEFNFAIDLCATADNSKLLDFCEDYLHNIVGSVYTEVNCQCFQEYIKENLLTSEACFMSPPYPNPKPFIEKAWEDSKYCKIIVLVPNTIKTCKYMDILDENNGESTFRKWKKGIEIRDFSRCTGFIHPSKKASNPSVGCMLIIMDRREG